MAQFAEVSELSDHLGMGVDLESARAVLLLQEASSAIQNELRQTVEAVADDVVIVQGNWSELLELPEWPVTEVTEVVMNGGTVDAASYTLLPDGYLRWGTTDQWAAWSYPTFDRWDSWGPIFPWGGPYSLIEVTYSYGYDVIPDGIKRLCLTVAGRAYREQLAGASVDYPTPLGAELTEAEKATLQHGFGRPRGVVMA